jgi:hypothetical protein
LEIGKLSESSEKVKEIKDLEIFIKDLLNSFLKNFTKTNKVEIDTEIIEKIEELERNILSKDIKFPKNKYRKRL